MLRPCKLSQNILKTDLKKSQICIIWCPSGPIWGQIWDPWGLACWLPNPWTKSSIPTQNGTFSFRPILTNQQWVASLFRISNGKTILELYIYLEHRKVTKTETLNWWFNHRCLQKNLPILNFMNIIQILKQIL